MTEITKKITLKERKKAQPNAVLFFSPEEKKTIVDTVAKNLAVPQQQIFFYTCQALGLNPLLNEICAISYGGQLSIQVMRDGFLTIAHRSGKFAGIESGVTMTEDGKTIINGWAKVYHKDFEHAVYQEADFSEYTTGKLLWASKPKTMIKKVAESMALRKAFNVSGVYAPEEMDRETQITEVSSSPKLDAPATELQIKTIKSMLDNNPELAAGQNYDFDQMTKSVASELIKTLATPTKKK